MNKTLLTERRITPEEQKAIHDRNVKTFKKIRKKIIKIDKQMNKLLPLFQAVTVFMPDDIKELSEKIKDFNSYCGKVEQSFLQRNDMETW